MVLCECGKWIDCVLKVEDVLSDEPTKNPKQILTYYCALCNKTNVTITECEEEVSDDA